MSFIDERMIYDENGKRLSNKIGVLSDLQTQNKDSLVGAVNEHVAQLADIEDRKADQSFVDSQFATIVSGAPKGTYTSLASLQSSFPNGTNGVMLTLDNGHWYYWNSTTLEWTDGGVYQASKSSPSGKFAVISDPLNFDSETSTLSWGDTWVFGTDVARIQLSANSISLSSFGNNPIILYFDTISKNIIAKYATDTAFDTDVFLGILFPYDVRNSLLNFKITIDSKKIMVQSTERTEFGNFASISDSVDFNTTTNVLSWGNTYIIGASLSRISLNAGSLDLTSFSGGNVFLYFNLDSSSIIARFSSGSANEQDVFLGILRISDLLSSEVNFALTINGAKPQIGTDRLANKSVTTSKRTTSGRYAFISDSVDFNTSTKVLSWGSTYVFGAGLSRTALAAGSLDLSGYGSNIPALYFNTDTNTIVARYVTDVAGENEIMLGVLWTTALSKSILNFNLTVNGSTQVIGTTQTTSLGRYAFISDPITYNTSTKILSWSASYVFGSSQSRLTLNAGTLDLSSYSTVAILFFNPKTGLIEGRTTTTAATDDLLFLGIFWLSKPLASRLNFNLVLSGLSTRNNFYNGVWSVMGDSITNFNEYQPVVNQIIGFNKINNYGVGGTSLTSTGDGDTSSMSYRIKNIDFTADLITVFGGTNDWGNIPAKPLGQSGDTTDTTVYGAIYSIINTVITNAPNARLAFITPLQRDFTGEGTTTLKGWSGETVNELGYKLEDVVNAIKEVCGQYGVPVLDLYHTSGITKFNLPQMTRDGLHPNTDLGMVRVGKQIAAFLKTL